MFHPFRVTAYTVLIFFLFVSSSFSQVNLKTGYNISVVSSDAFNGLLSAQNELYAYKSPFGKLTWLHGIEAGFRFKYDVHALELSYQGAYQSLDAEGQLPDLAFTHKMKVAVHGIGIGYQVSDKWFGAGSELQYQIYRTKFIEDDDTRFRHVQNMFAVKFYLMFTLGGSNGNAMALQPYYILPFDQYDFSPLADHLDVGNFDAEKWHRFGLSVLFYNGGK